MSIFQRVLLLIFFSFTAGIGVAQTYISTDLLKALKQASSPKAVIDIRNRLSYEMRVFNTDSSLSLAEGSLLLAEKEKYRYGVAVSNLCIGLAYIARSSYLLTKEYSNRTLVIADELNNDSLRGAANLAIAAADLNLSQYETSMEKALLAIKFYNKINNKDGITKARLVMAQLYQVKGDLGAAEKILKELAAEPRKDAKVQVNIYHTLANIHGMQGNIKEALALDEKALTLCEANGMEFLKSPVYDNMANCYMFSGNPEKAEAYFYKCLKIDSALGNKKQMADTYLNLGQLEIMNKNYSKAIGHLRHSIFLSSGAGYRQGTYGAYLLLSEAFKANNNPDSALASVNTGYLIKDSVINERSENKIAEMETLYQTERKEQQLKLQKSQLNKKNYYLIALSAAVLLISLSAVLYFRKRSLQNKISLQNEVLHQQDLSAKAIINAEENERKRIAADLHDGVGQMMSAAKMNLSVFEHELVFSDEAQRTKFETVIGMVDESCKEIRNVSHQMMPNALLKSGLASAVKEFLSKIDTRLIKVSLHAEGLNERLEGNVETVLYRVIQECVNNVLKHSGANHLDISIIRDVEGIAATIEDNGKGFDTAPAKKAAGIGLKNMESRIRYLRGTIDFSSAAGKGTLVAIHIPA